VERLTGLDGAFASLESPTTHLHIAGVLVFERCQGDGPAFEQVRDLVACRVHLVPPFRKRMMEVPFGLQHPTMVDDPEFDIDYHVRRVSVPSPGGLAELAELAAELSSRPLDRRRPLWEFHVVEGLEHGRLALIPKVHHSIIDGVSAAEVLAGFFDLSPEPVPSPLFSRREGARTHGRLSQGRPPERGDPSWSPAPLPGEWQRWGDILRSLPGTAQALVRTVGRTVQTARGISGRNQATTGSLPPAPFEAPRTSINRAISPRRRVAFARLPLDQVDRVRAVLGGTTNDVLLAAASGALRTFFAQRGEEPDGSLVAMVPISVRVDAERAALGNRLSALLVSLASGVEDAGARFRAIQTGMRSAKNQQDLVDSDLFAGWAQAMVPALATRLTRLATNLRLFDHVAPIFNLIVSSIPGPDVPLYLAGGRLVAMYPLGPIIEGAGVNITAFSYLGAMYVGIQGCWDLVPDLESIASGMERSLGELVDTADRRDRPVPWWHSELPA
jgi:diacylglycerol O-acyltransferase / wax synthase